MKVVGYFRVGNKEQLNHDELENKNGGYTEGDMIRKLEGQKIFTYNDNKEVIEADVIDGQIVEREE